MVECRCPFVMEFFGAEQQSCVSYLLTEFMPGGDIKALMDTRKTLPVAEARFYLAYVIHVFCIFTICSVYALCALCMHCVHTECTVNESRFSHMHCCTGALLLRVRHVRSGRDACQGLDAPRPQDGEHHDFKERIRKGMLSTIEPPA